MDKQNARPDVAAGRLAPEAYIENFSDLHPPLGRHEAFVEADRCYFCFDAPCTAVCPTSIDIPLFIRQIAADNSIGAAETILSQNVMGGMCARVCPVETLMCQVAKIFFLDFLLPCYRLLRFPSRIIGLPRLIRIAHSGIIAYGIELLFCLFDRF